MTQLVLANYIKLSSASADTQKMVRVDSTQAIKKDVTFARKVGVFNPRITTFSVPEYRFTVRADIPNVDGDPSGQRMSIDVVIRMPVKATKAHLEEQLVTSNELMSNPAFANAVIQQLFPCEGACTV